MNLAITIEISAGGVGSGCRGDKCGRPRKKDEGRQSKAKATYIPATKEKQALAEENEKAVAKAIGGQWVADHQPFDVIHVSRRVGFEVKTKIDGKRDVITMHPASLRRKLKSARKMKLTGVYTIIIDERSSPKKFYYAEGVGSFRIKLRDGSQNPNVRELKKLQDLRKII